MSTSVRSAYAGMRHVLGSPEKSSRYERSEPTGGEHECAAAGIPSTIGDAPDRDGVHDAVVRSSAGGPHPRFLRHLGASLSHRLRAARVRSWAGVEPVAPA